MTPDLQAQARAFLIREGVHCSSGGEACFGSERDDCECAKTRGRLAALLAEVAGAATAAEAGFRVDLAVARVDAVKQDRVIRDLRERLDEVGDLALRIGGVLRRARAEAPTLVIDSGAPAPEWCDCEVCRLRLKEQGLK